VATPLRAVPHFDDRQGLSRTSAMDSRPMPLDPRSRQARSFIRPFFGPILRPIFRRFPDPNRCNPTSSPPHAFPPLPVLRPPGHRRTSERLSSRRAQPDTRTESLDFPGSIPYPATVTAPPISGRAAFTLCLENEPILARTYSHRNVVARKLRKKQQLGEELGWCYLRGER